MARHPSDSMQGGEVNLAGIQSEFLQCLKSLEDNRVADRIWARDPMLWKDDPSHWTEIKARLGWLDVADAMYSLVADLQSFADEMKGAGIRYVVLCGMGGSSLCPEVLRLTFGSAQGYPQLQVLDSTDPYTISTVANAAAPKHSLYLIASKSGGTIEVDSLFRYFYNRAQRELGDRAGRQFAAVTDPGTALEQLARERGFRMVFLNLPDIGGRYSALSLFGLVPAALIGLDTAKLLDRARLMAQSCSAATQVKANPGVWLGAAIGSAAIAGRNKLTLLASPGISSFGLWVEQLIAESTGKEGKGIVPVAGEPLGNIADYGEDRLFVYIRLEGDENGTLDQLASQLEASGQPLVRLYLQDHYDLGAEFFRWEFATAVAGAILEIDPFDQPNVQESKDNTTQVLAQYQATGKLPTPAPDLVEGELKLYGAKGDNLAAALEAFVALSKPGDYFAILAYLPATDDIDGTLGVLRERLRAKTRLATTLGYGPRFLHSTGQLHKGGPNSGLFVQLTADDEVSLPIPGKPYDFGILKSAQATGDWEALRRHGRRALWIHLGTNIAAGLQKVLAAI